MSESNSGEVEMVKVKIKSQVPALMDIGVEIEAHVIKGTEKDPYALAEAAADAYESGEFTTVPLYDEFNFYRDEIASADPDESMRATALRNIRYSARASAGMEFEENHALEEAEEVIDQAQRHHTYKLKYMGFRLEGGEFTKDLVTPATGLTDSIMLGSVLHPDDGSYSQTYFTLDGRTGLPWAGIDQYKFWCLMAKNIAALDDLAPQLREHALAVFETEKKRILSMRRMMND